MPSFDGQQNKRYLIKYKSENGRNAVKSKIIKRGGKVKGEFKKVNAHLVELASDALQEMMNDAEVSLIEPDYSIQSSSDEIPWGVEQVQAIPVQQTGVNGTGIKIAVFDTGISQHNDLNISGKFSFTDDIQSVDDKNGHGTHVAGTIAALVNNEGVLGVSPNVSLYSVKVLNDNGTGNYSSLVAGIEWAIDNKMNIINMSLGGNDYSQIFHDAVKLAYDNNILIVAAAGNSGNSQANTITYPAKFDEVMAVGAIDPSKNRAPFSSVGSELEIMAPGVGIKSTLLNDSYGTKSGTSMAAPHVAGVAALLWSKDQSLTNIKVRNILDLTAVPLGEQNSYGFGMVDAQSALDNAKKLKNRKAIHFKKNKDNTGNHNGAITDSGAAIISASNITSSSITWNVTYPTSGQYGDRLEIYNSTSGWKDVSNTMYTTNGSYTSTGLTAGTSYMGRLTWYDYAVSQWKSIDIWITTTLNPGSITASNISSSSITWNVTYPVSGQWGNRIETWNSSAGWQDVSNTMYTTNGSYTTYGLIAGASYMGRVTWYESGTGTWKSVDIWVTISGNTPSIRVNSVQSNAITWDVEYPSPGQYGNRIELYSSVTGWQDISNTMYTNDGQYTISGLTPFNSYMGRLTWLENGVWKSIDVSIYLNYKNIDLNISKYGGTPTYIDNIHARTYLDTGKTVVNLNTPMESVSGLVNGSDYLLINEEIWLTTTYLSTLSNMITSMDSTQITLDVRDSTLIAYVDSPPQYGIAEASVGIQSATYPTNMCTQNCNYTVVLVGGMLTYAEYFNDTMPKLIAKYASIGKTVNFKVVFPYGSVDGVSGTANWILLSALQLAKIKLDLENSILASGGSNTATAADAAQRAAGGKLILIGHSGGGIASYRAAQKLRSQSSPIVVSEIVTVGSPKTAVETYWQTDFTYLQADCFFGDFVTWHGDWGLFNLYKPSTTRKVKLSPTYGSGGIDIHMGYFIDYDWTENSITYNNINNVIEKIWDRIQ